MATPEDPEDVRPALRQAEAKLARHLEEACDERNPENISEQSTDELRKLEEELLAAARAAQEAVRLRREVGEAERVSGTESAGARPSDASTETPGTRVREFRTASGSEWRVWEVRPGVGGRARKLDLYPADYVQGWLAFELVQGEGRRRLPKFSPDWCNAEDADLERLLEQAIEVPKRRTRTADGGDPPGERDGS